MRHIDVRQLTIDKLRNQLLSLWPYSQANMLIIKSRKNATLSYFYCQWDTVMSGRAEISPRLGRWMREIGGNPFLYDILEAGAARY